MIFGDLPVQDAEGAILAHSRRVGKTTFKKGRALSAEDVAALKEAGIASVVAARLEPGDIGEDAAARSEEHTSELQSLMRISYAVLCLKKNTSNKRTHTTKKNTNKHIR